MSLLLLWHSKYVRPDDIEYAEVFAIEIELNKIITATTQLSKVLSSNMELSKVITMTTYAELEDQS